ncbi:MAG: hypothetical protein KAH18_07005 [Psychromonas sp.]|nr:hypothetical protein [Psychromonas sp.]
MNINVFLAMLLLLTSYCALAGKVTIEKRSSLIRNDLFDQKRARVQEYRRIEADRNRYNEQWSMRIDPSCGLWRNAYLVYMCNDGRYYKGYTIDGNTQYRQLSTVEIKELKKDNSPSKIIKNNSHE